MKGEREEQGGRERVNQLHTEYKSSGRPCYGLTDGKQRGETTEQRKSKMEVRCARGESRPKGGRTA